MLTGQTNVRKEVYCGVVGGLILIPTLMLHQPEVGLGWAVTINAAVVFCLSQVNTRNSEALCTPSFEVVFAPWELIVPLVVVPPPIFPCPILIRGFSSVCMQGFVVLR